MAVAVIKHREADRTGSVALVADTVKELRVYGSGTLRLYSADEIRWVSDGVDDGDSPAPTSDFWLVPAGSGDGPTISKMQWAKRARQDTTTGKPWTSFFIWSAGTSTLRWDFR